MVAILETHVTCHDPIFIQIIMGVRVISLFIGLLLKHRNSGMPFLLVLPCTCIVQFCICDRLFIHVIFVKIRKDILDVLYCAGNGFQIRDPIPVGRNKCRRLWKTVFLVACRNKMIISCPSCAVIYSDQMFLLIWRVNLHFKSDMIRHLFYLLHGKASFLCSNYIITHMSREVVEKYIQNQYSK